MTNVLSADKKCEVIVHDPRVVWSIENTIVAEGCRSILSQTGHAYFKQKMRSHKAIYGGEISGHHYFREFSYCDSGMMPWLILIQFLSGQAESFSEIVKVRKNKFPSSGEININVKNFKMAEEKVCNFYRKEFVRRSSIDGLSLSFEKWRFNLRSSNTEPLVRLNIETKGDVDLLREKTREIEGLLKGL